MKKRASEARDGVYCDETRSSEDASMSTFDRFL